MRRPIPSPAVHWYDPVDDPNAGADMDNASRIESLLWTLSAALMIALLPISPPTEAIGDAGWALAAAVIVGTGSFVYLLHARRIRSWEAFYAAAILNLA